MRLSLRETVEKLTEVRFRSPQGEGNLFETTRAILLGRAGMSVLSLADIVRVVDGSLRTFVLLVSAHPYCASKFTR